MSTSSTGKVWVYRKEEIPVGTSKKTLLQGFPLQLRDQIKVTSLSRGIDLDQPTLTATFSFNERPGEQLSPSEHKSFYGFTPLYTPEGDIEADIIAITGLAGHAFGSWAASPHEMWLRDFLPNDLPRARVLLYGYDSNLAGNQSRNILAGFSNNFVANFHTMRSLSGSGNRPIIFIGHSLGCLIIKDALTDFKSCPTHHLSPSPPLVKGVIFFGAPHRGLNVTAMQSIMNGTPSAELIRELEWQSPTMQRLNNGFRHVCEDLHILAIYEKRPTATLRRSGSGGLERTGPLEMMVSMDSALLYLGKEIAIGLEQDHSTIAKVKRGQDGCYDAIVHFIRQSISSASTRAEPLQNHPESPPISSNPHRGRENPPGVTTLPTRENGTPATCHSLDVICQESPGPSKALKPLFLVPFIRDFRFINRAEIFNNINNTLKQDRRLALSGMGGVGKSQIAIEYCYRFLDDHPHAQIVWIHASTKQRFDQEYKTIARKLGLPGWNDPNIDTLELVFEWFNEADNGCWLMVLDNADDLDMFFPKPSSAATDSGCTKHLSDYLPQSSRGSMLITTRDERIGTRLAGTHASIVVNPMSPQEAQKLLQNGHKESSDSSNLDDSRNLLEALEYLPLAITQAAAYMTENHISLTEYLESFRKSDSDLQDLLDADFGCLRRDSDSHNSVIRTWKLSFDLISKQKPRAAETLSLMAVLDRHRIPKNLLRDHTDRDIDITTALGTLRAFSLIKAKTNGEYALHRLVQMATRKWLEMLGTTGKWQEKALSVVANIFPLGNFETWTMCESLSPHAQTVIQYGTNGLCPERHWYLLTKVAQFDMLQGRYEMACTGFFAAVEVQKKLFGSDHHSTLTTMSNLASAYQYQGQMKEAEKLKLQVLETEKRVLEADHPKILITKNNLAVMYSRQGRLEEAEKLNVQVLEARERVHGAEHPDTIGSMNNLAVTYQRQGRWCEAEKLYMQVIEAREKVLRTDHPDTLKSRCSLAVTYQSQGRLKEAEKLYLEVIEKRKTVLRAGHPNMVDSMGNLAMFYNGQDRHDEAIAWMKEVVDVNTKTRGANHPDTVNSVNWLKKWSKT